MEQLQLSVGCDSWASGTSPLDKPTKTVYIRFIPNKGNHMTTTQTKTEFLTEAMIEQVNDRFKVDAIESGNTITPLLKYEVAKKYIKVYRLDVVNGEIRDGRSVFMFIDKETGAVYKPASWRAPAKGIRFYVESLAESPEVVDQYGSFLYRR